MSNYTKLNNNLETLKLVKIKENIDKYIDLINSKQKDVVEALYELTNMEINLMQERAMYSCVRVAGFPFIKEFEDFDFEFQPSINKEKILDFKNLRYIEKKENILFIGSPGVGKTHLATSIGIVAAKNRILIIDEVGFLPIDSEGANMLFQLINKRYEKNSTIITSNKPFGKWHEIFGDITLANAILDRLLHHSHIININGKSYRLKDKIDSNVTEPNEDK